MALQKPQIYEGGIFNRPSLIRTYLKEVDISLNIMASPPCQYRFAATVSLFLVLSFALTPLTSGHAGEEHTENEQSNEPPAYLIVDPFTIAIYDYVFVLLLITSVLIFPTIMTSQTKKIIFILIALPVLLITLYISGSTIYLNLISESGGPVHWHADFEIWLCGEKITSLPKSHFPANYVGTATFHYHDDNRIHVEGLVIKRTDVSLGSFFRIIGGSLSKDTIVVPIEGGKNLTYGNGGLCPNGRSGKVKLYVLDQTTGEFVENDQIDDYVLAPEFYVYGERSGKGDVLKIVFETE